MLKTSIAVAFAATLTISAAGIASAAPTGRVAELSGAAAYPAHLQNVHWEWRHHRRVWVPDHRRPPYRR